MRAISAAGWLAPECSVRTSFGLIAEAGCIEPASVSSMKRANADTNAEAILYRFAPCVAQDDEPQKLECLRRYAEKGQPCDSEKFMRK
jgi:hypothetical protein